MIEIVKCFLYVFYVGLLLLEMLLLNKGSVFSIQECIDFNLQGLLLYNIEIIEEQIECVYSQYNLCNIDLDCYIFLCLIQDNNEILFFCLFEEYLEEMMLIIYIFMVGQVCQEFLKIYWIYCGLFIFYLDCEWIDDILCSVIKNNVKIVVVIDSEWIFGFGDQGIGGMGILIGKLLLYIVCGGISLVYILLVVLDVGINNLDLFNDLMYMGWCYEWVSGVQYEEFVDLFIQVIKCCWFNVLL